MNTLYEERPDITVGRITQLAIQPNFPPQLPNNRPQTSWPKQTFMVTFESAFVNFDETMLVTAGTCECVSANPRAVIADGTTIHVGGRITSLTTTPQ